MRHMAMPSGPSQRERRERRCLMDAACGPCSIPSRSVACFALGLRLMALKTQRAKVAVIVATALLKRGFVVDVVSTGSPDAVTVCATKAICQRNTLAGFHPGTSADAL